MRATIPRKKKEKDGMRLGEGDRVLLTGATGFVGRYLHPALAALDLDVRSATRSLGKARAIDPRRPWVEVDVHKPQSLERALAGCRAAFYLVHEVGQGNRYAEREADGARAFAEAARTAGVERLVYLGGPEPDAGISPHLKSRVETGRLLRESGVPTIELRAGLIVGEGGSSWEMVRRAAARLPVLPLPPFLRHHSWPIAIDDVVLALTAALRLPDQATGTYDIPGPERLSHDEVLRRTADLLGHRPASLGLPPLPVGPVGRLVGVVTGLDQGLTEELARGLGTDLDPTVVPFWEVVSGLHPIPFERTVRQALADAAAPTLPSGAAVHRIRERLFRIRAA
ncbi:MAG TPA: NAD(P)H-binding protein [Polyangiaceae bacterium LLY-WYZ-14_1]|nr:NAD(P)H-binding protein [Polyangiaceae bacterium LLY-WYZ-14_1]